MNTNRGIVKDLENLIKRQTSQMGEDVLLDAIAEIERLRSERDEARQLCCRMSAQFVYLSNELCTAKFVANEKGWDCFKEETP